MFAAFFFGQDKRSGKDYSHRKQWIRATLEKLAAEVRGEPFAGLARHYWAAVLICSLTELNLDNGEPALCGQAERNWPVESVVCG